MLKQVSNVHNANFSSIMNPSAHDTSILNYNGNSIHFRLSDGEVMVNLTEMGKSFGKLPNDFLRLPSTTQLINAIARKSRISESQLVTIKKGSSKFGGGTWANRLIGLSFAQWLSVDFHLICLEKIEEILTIGSAPKVPQTFAEALRLAADVAEQNEILRIETEAQQKQISKLEPKARYTDEVLQSASTFTTTQMADDLGMTARSLNLKLQSLKIQYKQSDQWHLTALYKDKGYTDIRVAKYKEGDNTRTSQSMVWTETGRLFLSNLQKSGKI